MFDLEIKESNLAPCLWTKLVLAFGPPTVYTLESPSCMVASTQIHFGDGTQRGFLKYPDNFAYAQHVASPWPWPGYWRWMNGKASLLLLFL